MSNGGRYRNEPMTLDQRIADLERRISVLERAPRIGSTSIDSGSLAVKGGDIVVEDADGNIVIRVTQGGGTQPSIDFTPLGDATTHKARLYSVDGTIAGSAMEQTIGKFEIRTDPDDELDGGFLHVYQTGSRMGFHSDATGDEAWFEAGEVNDATARLRIVGRWLNNTQIETTDAIYPGSFNVTAGFSSWTLTYFASFATSVVPIVGLLNSAGALSWCITAQSASSFTVAWTGTLAKTINMWNIRL